MVSQALVYFFLSILLGFFSNSKCWLFVLEEPSQNLIGLPLWPSDCRLARWMPQNHLRGAQTTGMWDSHASFQRSNYDADSIVQLTSNFCVFSSEYLSDSVPWSVASGLPLVFALFLNMFLRISDIVHTFRICFCTYIQLCNRTIAPLFQHINITIFVFIVSEYHSM